MHCQTVIKSKGRFRGFVGVLPNTSRTYPEAIRNKKRLPKWRKHPHALSELKDTTTPKPRAYEYDGNGNPITYQGFKDFRLMVWDEENRLQGINDNGKLHLYTYDHTGERAVKSSAESQSVLTNGQTSAVIAHTENYTAYINPYFVVNKGKFTKHYFDGSSRIVSKLGEGTFQQPSGLTAGGIDYIKQSAKQQEALDNYIRNLNVPPGPPTQQGIYASPEWTGQQYPSVKWSDISQNQEPPEGWPRPPKFNEPGDVPGPPVQYGDPVKPDNVKGGFGFKDNGVEEKNLYFYHPDHLGSSSYITDRVGKVTQHTEYIAFGEVLFDEHTTEVNMPYLFNGKELDSETGLYYYGARYYDAKISLWLNVDPLAEKYPFTSPYTYTNNNPIMLIDPTGMEPEKEYPDSYKGKLGKGDWRTSDRLNNTRRWKEANAYNTKNNIQNQYKPYSQVADYYRWVQSEAKAIGHQVKWMSGAIGLVDDLSMLENGMFSSLVNDQVEGLLQKLNVGIQNAAMPYFKDLLYGKYANTPLTGSKAQDWDVALVNYEQGVVAPPIYASASSEAIKYMDQLAGGSSGGFGWHSMIGGGSAPSFSTFGASVKDTQARIDIPLLMLYPSSYKPKWNGFKNMTGVDGFLNPAWKNWFNGKGWKK